MSPQLLHQFDEQGYIILPETIPADLLQRLRRLFDDQMQQPENMHRVTNNVNGVDYTTNLDYLMLKSDRVCLELLGWPTILETAAAICGPDFFLIQEFAVIKMLGDTLPVLWHQDMLHRRTGRCFTMGIYLDDADAGDGSLNIVPGSHRSGRTICELKNEPAAAVPVKAGQLLVHDMMLAHSSEPMRHNPLRRVLYFEFLSLQHVRQEALYSEELMQNRFALLEHAINYYRNLHPEEQAFNWTNPFTMALPPLEEICSVLVQAKPSEYCF